MLIEMQRADGSWPLNGELVRVLGLDHDDIEMALAGATGNEQEAKRALATALSICWLHENAADHRSEWRWLVEKAERWLEAVVPRPASGGSWIAVAQRLQADKSRA